MLQKVKHFIEEEEPWSPNEVRLRIACNSKTSLRVLKVRSLGRRLSGQCQVSSESLRRYRQQVIDVSSDFSTTATTQVISVSLLPQQLRC